MVYFKFISCFECICSKDEKHTKGFKAAPTPRHPGRTEHRPAEVGADDPASPPVLGCLKRTDSSSDLEGPTGFWTGFHMKERRWAGLHSKCLMGMLYHEKALNSSPGIGFSVTKTNSIWCLSTMLQRWFISPAAGYDTHGLVRHQSG